MPFQPIVHRWRAGGRAEEADRAETALATFAFRHPQVLANLDGDSQIAQSDREQLLEQVILVDVVDGKLVEDKILGYCRAHQCAGRNNGTAQTAVLGHVEERGKTERTLASTVLAKSPLARKNRSTVLFVDSLLRKDLADQKSLLNGNLLSQWIMWSFYQPRRLDSPFLGVSKQQSELIRRLGLGRVDPDEELLHWEHRLEPHQTAHRPTAFDAEAYDFFRPGERPFHSAGPAGYMKSCIRP